MLVFTRKPGEGVTLYLRTADGPRRLGRVEFVRPIGQRARLACDFDDDVDIKRDEIDELYEEHGNPVGRT